MQDNIHCIAFEAESPAMSARIPFGRPAAGSEADRQIVETWTSAQDSALTRGSYRHQSGRLLDQIDEPLAAVTVADLQAFVAGLATWRRLPSGLLGQP